MKSRWITAGLCALAAVILIVRLAPHGHRGRTSQPAARQGHAANAFAGLRNMVLEGTRANFGLGPGASPTQPFAVVADWGDAHGATTIVAVADGSASVYYSNGGGSMGGGQKHAAIRDAALKTLELASAALPQMHRTTEYPVAGSGQVSFYLVTDSGVFTVTAAEDEVSREGSPWAALGAATQRIVAEYRRAEEK